MNRLLKIFFLLLVVSCSEQEKKTDNTEKTTELKTEPFDNFEEKKVELIQINLSEEEKNKLIEKVKNDYVYYEENEFYSKEKPIKNRFSFLELNNDNKPDLIFQGWSGGEANFVQIHFSNNNGYQKPLTFYQNLKEINIENHNLKSLVVLDFGCCAEYVEHERKYMFDKIFLPTLIYDRARIQTASKEKINLLKNPIKFYVENDNYKLRGAPIIDDTSTYIYDFHMQGNSLATFRKGDIGYAWGINKTDSIREWWYVEMMPINREIENEMFYAESKKFYRRIGWMSSKYLKRIE